MQASGRMAWGVAIVLATVSAAANAEIKFNLTDLGTLGGATTEPRAINSGGQVVGTSKTAGGLDHAFLYSGGAMTDLGTLGGTASSAADMNDQGQIVGSARTADNWTHGFLYSGGAMTELNFPAPPDAVAVYGSRATGINNAGQVVGYRECRGPGGVYEERAGLYSGGVMTDLGLLSGYGSSVPTGINDSRVITGYAFWNPLDGQAFKDSGGGMTGLGISADFDHDPVHYAINTRGQIAGSSSVTKTFSTGGHPISYWEYTAVLNYNVQTTTLTPPTQESRAWGLNDGGRTVGAMWTKDGPQEDNPHSAFLYGYSDAQPLVDLNALVDPTSGWVLQTAYDINASNWIVGVGTYNGQARAFLLTPNGQLPIWTPPPIILPPTGILGDVNHDGAKNALDISAFIAAVTTGGYGAPYDYEADCNQDQVVNALDIQGFTGLVTGDAGSVEIIPEPATAGLLALGALSLLRRRG